MKKCSNCGCELSPETKICNSCGAKVHNANTFAIISILLFAVIAIIFGLLYADQLASKEEVSSDDSYKSKVQELQEENKLLKKQLAEEKKKNSTKDLESQISELNTTITDLDSQIKSKQAELDALTKKIDLAQIEKNKKELNGTTVYEDEKVKINYVKIRETPDSLGHKAVVFQVENKTNVTVTIQSRVLALDGITIDDNIIMSDNVAAKSKGFVYAEAENIDNFNPSFITGQLRVIDFSGSWESYDANFVNISVS